MLIICDIDGTLADLGPRLKIAGKEPKRGSRRRFQLWLDRLQSEKLLMQDKPIKAVVYFLNKSDQRIIYLTGRSEKYRKVTKRWLRKIKVPVGPLIMRNDDDWRTAAGYKEEALQYLLGGENDSVVVIDDDASGDCAAVYRKLGLTHLKVMPTYDWFKRRT